MSVPKIVKGQYLDVAVFSPASLTTPVVLCGLTTRGLNHTWQTGDAYYRDCQDPTMVPVRVVNITGESLDISGSGLFDRNQAQLLRTIGGQSLVYRFIISEPSGDPVDAGYFQGPFVCDSIQYSGQDGADVTYNVSFKNDGLFQWISSAGETALQTLTMTPNSVVHGVAYSGTVSGTTAGSTLAATSSDGTTLTVSGTGTTRTVAGTFSAAGTPTITLTETLAAATNSPKTSTKTLNVT